MPEAHIGDPRFTAALFGDAQLGERRADRVKYRQCLACVLDEVEFVRHYSLFTKKLYPEFKKVAEQKDYNVVIELHSS